MAQKIICGDCRKYLHASRGFTDKFDFVFADPPFNIGQAYSGYSDDKSDDEFRQFTFEWVATAHRVCRGVLALHGPDDLCELYLEAARCFGMKRIAWVNWHYRFGQCNRSNWIDSRCHCLIFAKSPDYTWNPDSVLVASDRATTYEDQRIRDTSSGGLRLPFTVWGVASDGQNWGRVQGNNAERVEDCPNQLPEVYLERLIRAYTNHGDECLDMFAGSGTTAVVAEALGRNCCSIDVSKQCCEGIAARLKKGAVRLKRAPSSTSARD